MIVRLLALILSATALFLNSAEALAEKPFVPICNRSRSAVEIFEWRARLPCAKITREIISQWGVWSIANVYDLKLEPGDFEGADNLRKLYIFKADSLEISPGTFAGLKNLELLVLSEVGLKTIPAKLFAELGKLVDLQIEFASIEEIEPGALDGLTNLKNFTMIATKISRLQRGVFGGHQNLEQIILAELPKLDAVEDDSFINLPKLRVLQFDFSAPLHQTNKAAFREVSVVEGLPRDFGIDPSDSWGLR